MRWPCSTAAPPPRRCAASSMRWPPRRRSARPGSSRVSSRTASSSASLVRGSALLQTIVAVVDHALAADAAVRAPRVHFEDAVLYVEPGIDQRALESIDAQIVRFGAPNLFFGGVQAVLRSGGHMSGAGDPR